MTLQGAHVCAIHYPDSGEPKTSKASDLRTQGLHVPARTLGHKEQKPSKCSLKDPRAVLRKALGF